jgi:hypothetical protein
LAHLVRLPCHRISNKTTKVHFPLNQLFFALTETFSRIPGIYGQQEAGCLRAIAESDHSIHHHYGSNTVKKLILGSSIALGTILLAGCGGTGNDASDMGSSAAPSTKALTPRAKSTATNYSNMIQQLYISYFGRPADPGGLAAFESQLASDGAPSTIQQLVTLYGTNPAIKTLIDSFGTSAESNALYGSSDTTSFVQAIFQNVLGRQPAASGQSFWVNQIDSGIVTKSNAALTIMVGALENTTAQGMIDATLIGNRVAVASNFTAALASPGQANAYSGSAAAASARSMLATVSSTTDVSGFTPTITSTVDSLISMKFTAIQAIVQQRCVPCHSATPTEPGYTSAPLGYMYDTPAEIAQYAPLMYEYAVQTTLMPYGNATGMTTAERTTFGNWVNSGALQNASSTPAPAPAPTPAPSPAPAPAPTPTPTPAPAPTPTPAPAPAPTPAPPPVLGW